MVQVIKKKTMMIDMVSHKHGSNLRTTYVRPKSWAEKTREKRERQEKKERRQEVIALAILSLICLRLYWPLIRFWKTREELKIQTLVKLVQVVTKRTKMKLLPKKKPLSEISASDSALKVKERTENSDSSLVESVQFVTERRKKKLLPKKKPSSTILASDSALKRN